MRLTGRWMLPNQQYARGNVTRATEASAALVRFWWTIATNLIGPANLSFLAARIIVGRSEGHVVNVSSRVAFRGEPETPACGASKAGLNAMNQSMAQALAPHSVIVYVVPPGFVETDMASILLRGPEGKGIRSQSPLGRLTTPE